METFEEWFNPFDEKLGQASKYEAIKYTWNHQQAKIRQLKAENKELRKMLYDFSDIPREDLDRILMGEE